MVFSLILGLSPSEVFHNLKNSVSAYEIMPF